MEVIIMKMTTKLIVILLALSLMSVAFVGCNTQNDTQNPAGNANSQATEKETEPEILTQYGIYSTEIPAHTVEELCAKQLANDANTWASGSSYSEEKINNVFKIADCIARYKEFVEEYGVQEQLDALYEETGFTLDIGFGAEMMKHYLGSTGETYDYTEKMEELLAHPKVSASQTTCINAVMKAAENLVADGQTVAQISQTEPMTFKSLKSQDGTVYYALGGYYGIADMTNVKRTGNTIMATVTFRIVDYYDWDKSVTTPEFSEYLAKLNDTYRTLLGELIDIPTLEGFCQADMAQLHYAGYAQNFMAHGTVTYNVTWTVGQTFDQATVTPAQ